MLDSVSKMIQKRWKNVMGQIHEAKAKAQEDIKTELQKAFLGEIASSRVVVPPVEEQPKKIM